MIGIREREVKREMKREIEKEMERERWKFLLDPNKFLHFIVFQLAYAIAIEFVFASNIHVYGTNSS